QGLGAHLRPLRLRGDGGRPLPRQLPWRHRPHVRRRLRPPRRRSRGGRVARGIDRSRARAPGWERRIRSVTTTRIGYVGLGTMGGQMARRLVTQGYRVTGYDIDATRAGRAKDGGVVLATSPAGAAGGADGAFPSPPRPAPGPRR